MTSLPKGYLKAAFDEKTSVSSSALNDLVLEDLRHNLSMGEGAQSAGLMPTGYENKAAFTEQQKQKREKDFANLLHQLHIARLQLMQELIDLQEAIEELTRKIEEKGRYIESIDAYLKESIAAGKFQVADDGYPIDVRLRTLIKQWEKDNFRKWDCSDKNEVLEILNEIKSQQESYKNEFEVEREAKKIEWDSKNDQLSSINETISKLQQQVTDADLQEKALTLIKNSETNNQLNISHTIEQTSPVKLENLKM